MVLAPDHPLRYEVVEGDTLWHISSKFLKFPWQWSDIWSIDGGHLTPTMKMKRSVIKEIYKDLYDKIYKN